MKTAVVYFSETGNTAKVAAAIAAALRDGPGDGRRNAVAATIEASGLVDSDGSEVILAPLHEAPALDDVDVVFVGMPVVKFGPPEPVRRFVATHCAGRDVALFVTHAAPAAAPPLEAWLEACKGVAASARLTGFFHCQGQLAEPVRQYMLASGVPMLVQFAEMASCADGQPDQASLTRAAAFARKVTAEHALARVATA